MASYLTDLLKKVSLGVGGSGTPISGLTLDPEDSHQPSSHMKCGVWRGRRVSVFVGAQPDNIKRLKTLRHPNILAFLDTAVGSGNLHWLCTEPVLPLDLGDGGKGDWAVLLAHQLAEVCVFLEGAGLVHTQLDRPECHFVSIDGGGLRVGGFEGCTSRDEYSQSDEPAALAMIARWTGQRFRTVAEARGALSTNKLVQLSTRLDTIPVDTDFDRSTTIRSALDYLHRNPHLPFCIVRKFLHSLFTLFSITSTETTPTPPPSSPTHSMDAAKLIVESVVRLGEVGGRDASKELDEMPLACLGRLLTMPDRGIRLFFVDQLPRFVNSLPATFITEPLYPTLQTGFSDAHPALRDATLKAMVVLAPKLPPKLLNGDLLRHFARLQEDPQPGCRVNVLVALGRVEAHLSPDIRQRALGPAYCRGLRDPFPPARLAAVSGLTRTADRYPEAEIAKELLPVLVTLLVDAESEVVLAAQKLVDVFISRLKLRPVKTSKPASPVIAMPNPPVAPVLDSQTTDEEESTSTPTAQPYPQPQPQSKGPLRLGRTMQKLG